MSQEVSERMAHSLGLMKKAGWVKSFEDKGGAAGFDIVWTKTGQDVLEAIWDLMETLGGKGRGIDQSTWGLLGYLAIIRYRDASLTPPMPN